MDLGKQLKPWTSKLLAEDLNTAVSYANKGAEWHQYCTSAEILYQKTKEGKNIQKTVFFFFHEILSGQLSGLL